MFVYIGSLSVLSLLAVGAGMLWYRRRKSRGVDEVKDLVDSAMTIEKTAAAMSRSADQSKSGAKLLANAIDSVNQAAESIDQSLESILSGIKNLSISSDTSVTHSREGKASVANLSQHLEDFSQELEDLQRTIRKVLTGLGTATNVIRNIGHETENLNSVVFQAKLLSFNASVEAARAGDAGRGFAVVAKEIGVLANSSGKASASINEALEKGLSDVANILLSSQSDIDESLAKVQSRLTESRALAHNCVANFSQIEESNQQVNKCAQQTTDQASQAKSFTSQTTQKAHAMRQSFLAQEKAAEESDLAAKSLNTAVEDLNQTVADIMAHATGQKIENISPKQVYAMTGQATIIDVRRPEEFNDELGHIPGATLLTLDDSFDAKLNDFDRAQSTILVCRSGGRSARACRIARSLGFRHIFNMDGGMLAWNDDGLMVDRRPELRKSA